MAWYLGIYGVLQEQAIINIKGLTLGADRKRMIYRVGVIEDAPRKFTRS